jgi:hypothetical protein
MTPANPTREGDAMGTCPTEKMKNLQATIEPGPVIAISRKKGKRTANSGSFTKGHKRGGRPKGVRNRFTEELKQTILDGLHNTNDEGLFGFVRDTAIETPTAGLSILGRLIPVSLAGTLDGKIVVVHRDETKD